MSASLEECLRAREMVRAIYRFDDRHLCGGCWHIVLDDLNTEDDHVEYCVKTARDGYEHMGHVQEPCRNPACHELGPLLLKMSRTQRRKLVAGGYERPGAGP